MNTSEVLNKAADLIEERGWTQGPDGWKAEGKPLCALGGIGAASDACVVLGFHFAEAIVNVPATTALADHLGVAVGVDGAGIYHWNDAEGRTASEVIEVLRACAVIEAAREEQDAAWATYAELVTA